MFIFLEIACYIALIIEYAIILQKLLKVDIKLLNYANENTCSDAVLHYSIKQYSESYKHDWGVAAGGIATTIISFGCCLIFMFWLSPVRKSFGRCCQCCSQPPKFEKSLTSLKDTMRDRYRGFGKNGDKKDDLTASNVLGDGPSNLPPPPPPDMPEELFNP